jgi:hypothetical protein
MTAIKSPGAVAAHGAFVTDQLERQVEPENNRQQQSASSAASRRALLTAASTGSPQRRTASVSDARAQGGAAEQHCADVVAAQEFHQIRKFVAACRRQWPGAMIVLRPDGAPTGANAPTKTEMCTRSSQS